MWRAAGNLAGSVLTLQGLDAQYGPLLNCELQMDFTF